MEKKQTTKGMMFAILSLSLLTVMAGAAVAPALGTLQEHFADSDSTTVQLIISMPALFIFLSSFIFPKLCERLGSKTIVLIGLVLYVAGGCMVGFANGAGIPCIIAAASRKAGKEAVSTVMPLLSAAMYIAQFLSPFIMSAVTMAAGSAGLAHLPFIWAAILAVILAVFAACMKKSR